MSVLIECRHILKWTHGYRGPKFHAMLTDPPYHLYDAKGRPADKPNGTRSNKFERLKGTGFMGTSWDGGDIAFQPSTWAALAKHLLPGAFIMAFSSTRGFHRQAVAMEDAGLIIRPMMGWLTSTSFPKASRIDTQVDKKEGAERVSCGFASNTKGRLSSIHRESQSLGAGWSGRQSLPATSLAQTWVGHRYGGQAIKNSLEVILVAQKPYDGKPVDSITATGAGALNIDGCRIGTSKDAPASPRRAPQHETYGDLSNDPGTGEGWNQNSGRWPSNIMLQHHVDCGDQCVPECPMVKLDEQAGIRKSGMMKPGQQRQKSKGLGGYHGDMPDTATQQGTYGDSGSVSRFFFQSDWALENTEPVFYCPKAARSERDAGLDDVPPQQKYKHDGSGNSHECFTAESAKDPDWDKKNPCYPARCNHPTVKPLRLCQHLATLLLPPAEYAPRRLLAPFAGVASECIGAMLAGWEEVIGIEMDQKYCEIGRKRIEYWAGKSLK